MDPGVTSRKRLLSRLVPSPFAELVFDQRFAEIIRSVGARQSEDRANLAHFLAAVEKESLRR
jgi:hypothetical protein